MILQSLSTRNFRNLAAGDCPFHPAANLFLGPNGQGKTNLLEAIYFLATAKSFRTSNLSSLFRIGETRLFAQGSVERQGLQRTISIGLEGGETRRRELLVNGQKMPLQRYVAELQVFAYSAARLEIIRGGPEERRKFLDRGIASVDPGYISDFARYVRALKQRNALLQKIAAGAGRAAALEAWDVELVAAAIPVVRARAEYAGKVAAELARIADAHAYHVDDLVIEYRPSGFTGDEAEGVRALGAMRKRELAAGFTLMGPHRDNVEFRLRGLPAVEILSSGEIKMTVLFLKFAKISLYRSATGDVPVFLLDDVDAELDLGIIERLFSYIGGTTQLFATSAKASVFRHLPIGRHAEFVLENGALREAGRGRPAAGPDGR